MPFYAATLPLPRALLLPVAACERYTGDMMEDIAGDSLRCFRRFFAMPTLRHTMRHAAIIDIDAAIYAAAAIISRYAVFTRHAAPYFDVSHAFISPLRLFSAAPRASLLYDDATMPIADAATSIFFNIRHAALLMLIFTLFSLMLAIYA